MLKVNQLNGFNARTAAGGAPRTISFGGTTVSQESTNSHTSSSVNWGTDPGNGVALIGIGNCAAESQDINSVTIQSQSAVKLHSQIGSDVAVSIWVATGVTNSSGTVTMTVTTSANHRWHVHVFRLTGSAPTVADDTGQTTWTGTGTQSMTGMDCNAGAVMLAMAANRNGIAAYTSWSLDTEVTETEENTTTASSAFSNFASAQSNLTINFDVDEQPGAACAVAINA